MGSNEVSERIKRLRSYYNLSQEDLAGIAHVTKAAVSRWEKGEINNLKTGAIKKICDYYPTLNPSWFLGGDAPMFLPTRECLELSAKIHDKLDNYTEDQLKKLLKFMDEFL